MGHEYSFSSRQNACGTFCDRDLCWTTALELPCVQCGRYFKYDETKKRFYEALKLSHSRSIGAALCRTKPSEEIHGAWQYEERIGDIKQY